MRRAHFSCVELFTGAGGLALGLLMMAAAPQNPADAARRGSRVVG